MNFDKIKVSKFVFLKLNKNWFWTELIIIFLTARNISIIKFSNDEENNKMLLNNHSSVCTGCHSKKMVSKVKLRKLFIGTDHYQKMKIKLHRDTISGFYDCQSLIIFHNLSPRYHTLLHVI